MRTAGTAVADGHFVLREVSQRCGRRPLAADDDGGTAHLQRPRRERPRHRYVHRLILLGQVCAEGGCSRASREHRPLRLGLRRRHHQDLRHRRPIHPRLPAIRDVPGDPHRHRHRHRHRQRRRNRQHNSRPRCEQPLIPTPAAAASNSTSSPPQFPPSPRHPGCSQASCPKTSLPMNCGAQSKR